MTAERHVYLVDDDDALRRSASFMLKTSGLVVTTFASGVDFLSEARHLERGCVLLDVRMPKLDGLAVQAELKACGIALPVIVITGHGDVTVAVGAMKAGAVNFLEKLLLVDDDVAVRNSLRLLLTARGYNVDLYAGGKAVLEPNLVGSSQTCLIADYLMPDIDGLSLFKRLRKQGWLGPALLISGHFDATLEQRALAVGYVQVFEKPLDHERMLDVIARLKVTV